MLQKTIELVQSKITDSYLGGSLDGNQESIENLDELQVNKTTGTARAHVASGTLPTREFLLTQNSDGDPSTWKELLKLDLQTTDNQTLQLHYSVSAVDRTGGAEYSHRGEYTDFYSGSFGSTGSTVSLETNLRLRVSSSDDTVAYLEQQTTGDFQDMTANVIVGGGDIPVIATDVTE